MTGIGRYARNLAHALAGPMPDGPDLLLICSPGSDLDGLAAGGPRVRVSAVCSPDPLWDQVELPLLLERWGAEVYHTPVLPVPVVRVCPTVLTLHDAIPAATPNLCSPSFRSFFDRWIDPSLRVTDHVVTVSEAARSDILSHLGVPPDGISVVYQSIPRAFFKTDDRAVAAVRERHRLSGPYVLFVGSLEPRKGPDRLIATFGRVAQGHPDVTLVLAGSRADPAYPLEAMVRDAGVSGRVRLLGYVDDGDLPALYAGARAFVFPSRAEGFGLPVLEAMAAGTPVAAADIPALRESAGDAALFADPDDETALARAVETLLTDGPQRAALIEQGRRRARSFSPDRQAREMTALYRRVADGEAHADRD